MIRGWLLVAVLAGGWVAGFSSEACERTPVLSATLPSPATAECGGPFTVSFELTGQRGVPFDHTFDPDFPYREFDVMLAVDITPSFIDDFPDARNALVGFLDRLSVAYEPMRNPIFQFEETVRLGTVVFGSVPLGGPIPFPPVGQPIGDDAGLYQPLQEIADNLPTLRQELLDLAPYVDPTRPPQPGDYRGNHAAAIERAHAELLASPAVADGKQVIVLVTDGLPAAPGTFGDAATAAEAARDLAAADGIDLYVAVFENGSGDFSFLSTLSTGTGCGLLTPSPDDLELLLYEVALDLEPSARYVQFEIEPHPGFQLVDASSTEGVVETSSGVTEWRLFELHRDTQRLDLTFVHDDTTPGGLRSPLDLLDYNWLITDEVGTYGDGSGNSEVTVEMPVVQVDGCVAAMTASPATAARRAGDPHQVTASLDDDVNAPVAGISIEFSVSATDGTPIPGGATLLTDSTGKASFTWTNDDSSSDLVLVEVLSQPRVSTELSANAIVDFVAEVSPPGGTVPLRVEASPLSPTGYFVYFEDQTVQGYNVYSGPLGEWYDHASGPICDVASVSVGPDERRTELLVPPGNRYFLVTAFSGTVEGLSGRASNLAERNPGQNSCLPQGLDSTAAKPK